ncbi:hypothetical protein SLEP1_g15409 [Rubroshorea leprosula]|uniref:Non-specific lipid-transfer protein n=1 Tax=Rubroshorea leprosula TaxID=152421 RepID=A0AAV5IXR6_9ROSI|nr:hypothetical protein SLEP1_g15409 [Rubroshorea leprosula]
MASSLTLKLACVVVLYMTLSAALAQAITCDQVSTYLGQCINYVRGYGTLPPACCTGIRSLNAAAMTSTDRQTVCNCLKSATDSISGVDATLAAKLPAECGVNLPVSISASTNCSEI